MAKMNSKTKYMLDAAPSITFRAPGLTTLTADTASDAITLDALDGYWNTAGELADTTFAIVIHVTSLDFTTGDETYDISLEAGPVGFASSIKPQVIRVPAVGQYVMLVDIDTIKKLKATTEALRLALDVSGTTPIIAYNAYIAGAIIR